MPQIDLETILCGVDGKIACETMIGGEDPAAKVVDEDPDMPAESYQVRIGEDIDWADINAVYDRDDSTKGNTNPKSQHANQKQQQQPPSNSQRFSGNLKPKAPIIALPNKMQLGASLRRPINGRMFLKKKISGFGRKSAIPPPEPGSPKVSCFGKVLSDGDRDRRQHHKTGSSTYIAEEEELRPQQYGEWFVRLAGIFRCGRHATRDHGSADNSLAQQEKVVPFSGRLSSAATLEVAPVVTPGLGAMRRLSSGRRPTSWGADDDSNGEMHVASSGSLDRERDAVRRSVEY